MNLTKIHVKNFLSHKDTVLDLQDKSILLVVGNNGAGKSSLVRDSVTWALFGIARNTDRAGDQLITTGEDYVEVEITFSIGTDTYSVIRGRNKGSKSYLSIFKNEEDISTETIADTQKEINRILGVTYKTFSHSVCIEQGKLNSFSTLTPGEAKKVFYDILDLEKYERYESKVRDIMRILNNDMITYRSRADTLEQESVPLEGSEEKLKAIDGRLVELEQSLKTGKNKEGYLHNLLKEQMATHQENLDKARKDKTLYDVFVSEKERLFNIVSQLDSDSCPLCLQTWGEGAGTRTMTLTRLEAQLSLNKEGQTNANAELQVLESADFEVLESDIQDVKQKIVDLEKVINQVREKRGYILSMYENQVRIKGEVKKLRDKQITKRSELVIYKYLLDAFGKNGIPTLIMASALEELQVIVNEFLEQLSGGRFKVEFQLQKEVKGGVSDTLQVLVYDGVNSRAYYNFSGGEKTRVDLAIRLGMAVLLAHRNNFKTGTLIIDEASESLDDEGRAGFVQLLKSLPDRFKKVIVITHTDIKDQPFESVEIIKENRFSSIKGMV